jgi:hypothetical protein
VSREVLQKELRLPVSVEKAYAWHERLGALDRLLPPWEAIEVTERGDGVQNGSRVVLTHRWGPLRFRWVAEHCDCERGHRFRDVQRSGPFRHWDHTHCFEPDGEGSVLRDAVEYEVPGGSLGALLGGRYVRRKLDCMFAHRHRTLAEDLRLHEQYADAPGIRVLVSGSRGLIGKALVPLLTTGGHDVVRLVRGGAGAGDAGWSPERGELDQQALAGLDAVVHLAGENIAAARWTTSFKQKVRTSRVRATRLLCESLARQVRPPRVLVSASAVGFYGDRGDTVLDEESGGGTGFLADVAREWEAATRPAEEAGVRVVHLRFGMVLSPLGGALRRLLPIFKFALGGPVGTGRQYWSWIGIDDAAGAIYHALMTESLAGPVNAVAPAAVTNRDFCRVLARVLRRPAWLPLPAAVARLALGEMANELLLASTRVAPRRLLQSGYRFRDDDLEDALRHMLGRVA